MRHNEYTKQVKTATVKLLQHSKMPMYKRKSYASQLFLARLNNFVPYKRRNLEPKASGKTNSCKLRVTLFFIRVGQLCTVPKIKLKTIKKL